MLWFCLWLCSLVFADSCYWIKLFMNSMIIFYYEQVFTFIIFIRNWCLPLLLSGVYLFMIKCLPLLWSSFYLFVIKCLPLLQDQVFTCIMIDCLPLLETSVYCLPLLGSSVYHWTLETRTAQIFNLSIYLFYGSLLIRFLSDSNQRSDYIGLWSLYIHLHVPAIKWLSHAENSKNWFQGYHILFFLKHKLLIEELFCAGRICSTVISEQTSCPVILFRFQ